MVRKSHDVRGLALPQQLDYHRDPKAGPRCLAVFTAPADGSRSSARGAAATRPLRQREPRRRRRRGGRFSGPLGVRWGGLKRRSS